MTTVIQQSVEFAASPETLYEMYVDSRRHSQATGQKARASRRVGAMFHAFDGSLRGKNLKILPKKMIVQSWRSMRWPNSDPDSILILTFSKTAKGGRVDLVHANVPAHDHKGVTEGWKKYYWEPWAAYIAERRM